MTANPRTCHRLAAAVTALSLLVLAGCSGSDSEVAAASPSPAVVRDLTSYDAYVLGSGQNNPLFADVYGIRFSPFAIDRITRDKRISTLGADDRRVMVAAADQDVDRLAQVTGSGDLVPVPGLGRPFAYTPTLRDGVMYFTDAQGDKAKGEFRAYAWDLAKQKKRLLFRSKESFGGVEPLGGGRLLITTGDERDLDQLAIRNPSGKLTEYPLHGRGSGGGAGKRYLAATLAGAGNQFGEKPEALVLIERKSGRTSRITGLQFVCWTPNGTRILARRTAVAADSQLVLLDPANPDALTDVGTVPGLVIYSGTWVRGDAATSR